MTLQLFFADLVKGLLLGAVLGLPLLLVVLWLMQAAGHALVAVRVGGAGSRFIAVHAS